MMDLFLSVSAALMAGTGLVLAAQRLTPKKQAVAIRKSAKASHVKGTF